MNFENKNPPQTPFDSLISTPQLNMMKVMIPFLPASNQSGMALMVRMQEFQETMKFYSTFPGGIQAADLVDEEEAGPFSIFNAMRPYLPEGNGSMVDSIMSMISMMDMFKEMSNMGDESSSDSSNTGGFGGMGGSGAMDMVKVMLTPEQQGMFEMFSMMNDLNNSDDYDTENNDDNETDWNTTTQSINEENDYEGDYRNGSMDE